MNNISRNVVAISGATGYAGCRLATAYARDGFDLVLIGRSIEKLEILSNQLEQDFKIIAKVCLVTDVHEISERLDADLAGINNRIFCFINAIGTQNPVGSFLNNQSESWISSIEINLTFPAILSKYFAGVFLQNGSGSIILFSGGGASQGRENFSAYASAKTGLVRFVETFSHELRSSNIRINAIAPGVMPSRMMEEILDLRESAGENETKKAQSSLSNSKSEDSRFIDLCKFLTSDASTEITGKFISAEWDNWREWPKHLEELESSDLYTLRRITSRDRGLSWGDL